MENNPNMKNAPRTSRTIKRYALKLKPLGRRSFDERTGLPQALGGLRNDGLMSIHTPEDSDSKP